MRKIWRQVLAVLATAALRKHKVNLVAIVGDGQNALLRELIFEAINIQYPARQNAESIAAEFGIPLTILGYDGYVNSYWEWVQIFAKSVIRLLKPKVYEHVIVLEMNAVDDNIRQFWLEKLSPSIVVDTTGQNLSTAQAVDIAVDVASQFDVDPQISRVILEDLDLPEAKVVIHPGVDGSTIVDATHYFYPISLATVLELLNDDADEGAERIIINASEEDIETIGTADWQINPANLVTTPDTVVVLRGYRPVVRHKYNYLFLD